VGAYNGGLGAEHPAGSRSRARGHEVEDAKPFCFRKSDGSGKFASVSKLCKLNNAVDVC